MNRNDDRAIRYLSVDEMMLKIAKMRADQATSEPRPLPETGTINQRPSARREPIFVFPDYVSFCDPWNAVDAFSEMEASAASQAKAVSIRPREISAIRPFYRPKRPAELMAFRKAYIAPLFRGRLERFAFGVAALGITVVILAGTIFRMQAAGLGMLARSNASGTLVAGSEPWEEISNDDSLALSVVPDGAESAHRARKIEPGKVEDKLRQVLASNGFPDIGVSASSRGEVYLAGDVYSMDEAGAVKKIAIRATHGLRVFFMHPDVQESEGPAYFGATAENDPAVWGACIRSVVIGSPAYKAGIRIGDVVREFDHETIADAQDLSRAVSEHKPGERVAVRVWRDGGSDYLIARLTELAQFALR